MPANPKRPFSLTRSHRKRTPSKRKTRRQRSTSPCNIPTRAPVLNYSSSLRSEDFYRWVNEAWLKEAKIPADKSIVDSGEDTEKCLYEKSIQLIEKIRYEKPSSADSKIEKIKKLIRIFANSCLHARVQKNSIAYLQKYIHTLHCISSKEDVFQRAFDLNLHGFKSLFDLQITLDDNGKCQLFVDVASVGLHAKRYMSNETMKLYKKLLTFLGNKFQVPNLEKVIPIEKLIVLNASKYYTENHSSMKGSEFLRKFPGIPWKLYFETFGIHDWKKRTIFYSSPRYIRFIGRFVQEVSLENWKLFFANCYLLSYLHVLPPPYDEMEFDFFGRLMSGVKQKMPQMQLLYKLITTYLSNEFSELFWKEEGNEKLQESVETMSKNILHAAMDRVEVASWLEKKTRQKSIEKLEQMKQSIARPRVWLPALDVELDEKNLLHNCIVLAQGNAQRVLQRLDKPFNFWEDAITRVNASYYKRNNQIVIPFGQLQPPFYSEKAETAWNYGAIGSIIGHEISHGFDADGKDFDAKGRKRSWWTAKNNRAYKKKSRALIDLFSAVTMQGHHVNGKQMLSENIADLVGLAISLHALKKQLGEVSEEEKKKALQTFFIAFATSWRTKYREERLTRLLEKDVHAPAELRVNLVVSQFQEWVDAFDIDEKSPMFIKPDERIVIF